MEESIVKNGKSSIILNFMLYVNVLAKCYSSPGYYQMGADEHHIVKFMFDIRNVFLLYKCSVLSDFLSQD